VVHAGCGSDVAPDRVFTLFLKGELVHDQGSVIVQVKPITGGAPGGLADPIKLLDHYTRHGADFGAPSAAQYEQMADAFLNGPRGIGVLQKVRANGDVVRYDPATQAFGVVKPDGTIRTYYEPDPAVHGYPTNMDYFHAQ
jgi:filamentous hemagglutinin